MVAKLASCPAIQRAPGAAIDDHLRTRPWPMPEPVTSSGVLLYNHGCYVINCVLLFCEIKNESNLPIQRLQQSRKKICSADQFPYNSFDSTAQHVLFLNIQAFKNQNQDSTHTLSSPDQTFSKIEATLEELWFMVQQQLNLVTVLISCCPIQPRWII